MYLRIILLIAPYLALCQTDIKTYNMSDDSDLIYENSLTESERYNRTINQIDLKDSTFVFYNRPKINCGFWADFSGIYKVQNDTITFLDKYQLVKPDMEFTSNTDRKIKSYIFNYKYDNEQKLEGREIKIKLVYDFDSKLKDISKTYTINNNHTIEIPFEEIRNHNELTSFGIVLNPNTSRIIWSYFSVSEFVNEKEKDLPNIIDITFISKPKKEEVTRITKGIINENEILILSSRSKSSLEDNSDLISFKRIYKRAYSK
jgi:hypothetical protein